MSVGMEKKKDLEELLSSLINLRDKCGLLVPQSMIDTIARAASSARC